ncbi:MAG: HNH endonuclease signature motif containing protein [Pirellulaceae bacterium]
MTAGTISASLRSALAAAARHRCGYCKTSELVTGAPLEVEHLAPRSRGGTSVEENLWLACRLCNAHKSDRIQARDPRTGQFAALFNPRRDDWSAHFRWSSDGLIVEGVTPQGRATVEALGINRPSLVVARRIWVAARWHPPQD